MWKDIIDFCQDAGAACIYQCGGSLLRPDSPDIDILMASYDRTEKDIMELCKKYTDYHLIKIEVCAAYGKGDEDRKDQFSMVLKMWHDTGQKVDICLQFVDKPVDPTAFIRKEISKFPLSIQMVAKNIETHEYVVDAMQGNYPIIAYGDCDKAVNKYKKYYPYAEIVRVGRRS